MIHVYLLSILISVSFRFVFLFSLPVSLLFWTLALAYYDNRIAYKVEHISSRQCKDYVTSVCWTRGASSYQTTFPVVPTARRAWKSQSCISDSLAHIHYILHDDPGAFASSCVHVPIFLAIFSLPTKIINCLSAMIAEPLISDHWRK
ncbi:hypothetical protein EDB83DRAFT_1851801 [Lactarius deliciosus]|nr:hypothetical protein EDB83DRAFT_1851801 [Lactarius deliciosus]